MDGGSTREVTGDDILDSPVLVLNRSYQPVRVTTARSAFLLLFAGRAHALDADYEPHDFAEWFAGSVGTREATIGTLRGPLRVPRVVLLTTFNRVPRTPLRLSRRNIFLRDDYTCQYCGVRPALRELNLDHVQPRSRGGPTSWENLVTSCRPCNLDKGHRTPAECGKTLARVPRRPTWSVVAQLAGQGRRYREWAPFLGAAQ